MLSCKEIVKSVSSEERPTWRRQMEIRLHLLLCDHCRKYAKQLDLMKTGFKNLLSPSSTGDDESKIQAIETEVIRKLDE